MKRYSTSLAMAASILLVSAALPACERSTAEFDPQIDGVLPHYARDTSYILADQKKLFADQGTAAPAKTAAPAATTTAPVEPTAVPAEGEATTPILAPAGTPAAPADEAEAPKAPPQN